MSKLESLGFVGPYSYQANGSVVGTFGDHPYNLHPDASPDAWEAFQEDLKAGLVHPAPWVAPIIPEPTPDQVIRTAITKLEKSITPRRLREAVLGTDAGWLAATEAEIDALRKRLP